MGRVVTLWHMTGGRLHVQTAHHTSVSSHQAANHHCSDILTRFLEPHHGIINTGVTANMNRQATRTQLSRRPATSNLPPSIGSAEPLRCTYIIHYTNYVPWVLTHQNHLYPKSPCQSCHPLPVMWWRGALSRRRWLTGLITHGSSRPELLNSAARQIINLCQTFDGWLHKHEQAYSYSRRKSCVSWGVETDSCRKIMMGEGNRVASVTLFTFTLKLGPHAHSLCEARPPCSRLARAVVG